MYCIYQITNKVNGKTYIGQHKYKELNDSYMGSGKILKKAQEKYGIENFEKKILVFNITSRDFINILEKEYIAFYRCIGKAEYNIANGGFGGGFLHTEETKKKMSEHNAMHKKEYRDKISKKLKGRVLTDEWKNKLSKAAKGKARRARSEVEKSKIKETFRQIREAYYQDNKGLSWNEFQKAYYEYRRLKDE